MTFRGPLCRISFKELEKVFIFWKFLFEREFDTKEINFNFKKTIKALTENPLWHPNDENSSLDIKFFLMKIKQRADMKLCAEMSILKEIANNLIFFSIPWKSSFSSPYTFSKSEKKTLKFRVLENLWSLFFLFKIAKENIFFKFSTFWCSLAFFMQILQISFLQINKLFQALLKISFFSWNNISYLKISL